MLPPQRCLNDGMKATGLSIKAQTEAAGCDVDICVYPEQDEGNGILGARLLMQDAGESGKCMDWQALL